MKESYPSNVFFTWDIHYKCDYYCAYCFLHFEQDTANIEAVYLEPERWTRIWQDVYERYGSCHIHVTGGEPFTYPGFIDLISKISQAHTFEFSTNFSFDIKEFTAKVNPNKVKISPSFHPEFVSPEDFINKYIQLKEDGYMLGAITVVGYPPFLEKMFDYRAIFEKGQTKLIIYPYRGPYQERMFPDGYNEKEKELLRLLGTEIAAKVSENLMDSYSPSGSETSPQKVDKIMCRMGQRYAKIIPNGEVFRCCAAVWDPLKTWPNWGGLGNIADNTFNLLSSPQFCLRPRKDDCVCYKAMIVGEEEKWLKHWSSVKTFLDSAEEDKVLNTAKSLRDESRLDEVVDKLKAFLLKRDSIQAFTLLGEVYADKKDFISAKKAFETALEKNQESGYLSGIYRGIGKLHYEQREFAAALDYLDKAIKLAEENANRRDKIQAIYEKTRVYYAQKDYSLARQNMELLLSYEPENKSFKELSQKIGASV